MVSEDQTRASGPRCRRLAAPSIAQTTPSERATRFTPSPVMSWCKGPVLPLVEGANCALLIPAVPIYDISLSCLGVAWALAFGCKSARSARI